MPRRQTIGFDGKAIRAKLQASAEDHVTQNGYAALVHEFDQETGETCCVFRGELPHPTQRDALAAARAWIDAEVGRQERILMLREQRKDGLADLLAANLDKAADLKEQRADIGKKIKEIEAENAMLVRECRDPAISINLNEASGHWTYTITDKGVRATVEGRQLDMFLEGDAPDILQLTSDADDD